jgi:Peptidase family M28
MKFPLALIACWTLLAAPALHLAEGPEAQSALDHISADSLRGNLSFLASDALEGRDTPSRGLDIAAEFIASQFRRAGLEAPIDSSYFQSADFFQLTRSSDGVSLVIDDRGEAVRIDPADVTVIRGNAALNMDSIPIYKLSGNTPPEDIAGKAVLIPSRGGAAMMRSLREKKVAMIVTTGSGRRGGGRPSRELIAADQVGVGGVPVIAVRGEAAGKLFESLPAGPTTATLTLRAPGPQREQVKLRNVIGWLRGSDPKLKDTYIIVTAHYDHLGIRPPADDRDDSDRIYNGANDDGSGVVSVIELAGALASMHPHPRRSIVFMTVFGEEEGLLGSQYYGRHPVFPLDRTVADVNIEQVGRTDDSEEPQIASATFTGFNYSDLPALFAEAGKACGVKVFDRNPGNDSYFARSDNQALADAGIPSHTVAVALDFPDYHQVGDEWHKIDYTNMTKIDRMLGLGIISLANDPESPKWNESNQNTTKYIKAWKNLLPALTN